MKLNRTFQNRPGSLASETRPGRGLRSVRAFTLIEILLAVAIFSVVLLAINTVFFSALRLRRSVINSIESAAPLQQVFTTMRRDLQMVVPPSGLMIGDFRVGAVSATSSTIEQAQGIEFFASSGRIREHEPWGDVQRVIYSLREPANRTTARGRDLYRSVSQNLLSTMGDVPEEQWLIGNVESLEFECFSGTGWQATWDTSATETNLPVAVRVRITLATEEAATRDDAPYEILVPITVQQPFIEATTTEEEEES